MSSFVFILGFKASDKTYRQNKPKAGMKNRSI